MIILDTSIVNEMRCSIFYEEMTFVKRDFFLWSATCDVIDVKLEEWAWGGFSEAHREVFRNVWCEMNNGKFRRVVPPYRSVKAVRWSSMLIIFSFGDKSVINLDVLISMKRCNRYVFYRHFVSSKLLCSHPFSIKLHIYSSTWHFHTS